MNQSVQTALDTLEDIAGRLGPWGNLAAGGLAVVEGAILNSENGVDPTPIEVQKLLDKINTPGESLYPAQEE